MKKIKILVTVLSLSLFATSCLKDLDTKPLDEKTFTVDKAYADQAAYKQGLAKIYSVMAVSGQDGSGSTDITGLDPGNSQFLRSLWNVQVVTTDECKNGWGNDSWVPELNNNTWSNIKNESIDGVYYRAMFIVALSNEYLKQTTDAKLDERGHAAIKAEVAKFRLEARFMRALAYSILLDVYGNPPYMTDEHPIGGYMPSQIGRKAMFEYIESELKAIEPNMLAPRTNEYGRADQGAAWTLLARLYLNAEVYTGTARYTDVITYAKKVIGGGYVLSPTYSYLFMADNDKSAAKNEIIFPIVFDGNKIQTWGGMTYLVASSRSGSEKDIVDNGTQQAWDGNRATAKLVDKFTYSDLTGDYPVSPDKRAIFFQKGRSKEITNPLNTFTTQGWSVFKFTNKTSTGGKGSHNDFPDTDFPYFRLADVYLMLAEAVVRGGTGATSAEALQYFNALRVRAYGSEVGNVSALTLPLLIDERSRELYWEGTRRTDLIRFGMYTGSTYLWPMKGGQASGVSIDAKYNLFPIPVADLMANPNLVQNTGY
ncbi:MAG: RagB/SusD family nutrient uptake outer membrane protein [Bacteroidales bacterium]|nr:RagB/SusD family nutrient uptake outer membrane protein [Bacteroidales bacterium]MDD2280550.1 RagB/SusD family nutrient uptake outer membrane protein [Bacteroidales bacterium]MDD4491529.1 RagB/SusD family nutrient uptake outer membrane protein [Bacteroidales bacterium]